MESTMIGNKIALARKKMNISQAQLAESMFVSPQAVGKWERGESMPDIITLNRLAELLEVDLNYFSERFGNQRNEKQSEEININRDPEYPGIIKKKTSWDLSQQNLTDSDFSGLKNLHDKLSSTNIQRCSFVGSDLSRLILTNNHIGNCDFSSSDISYSQIQKSMLSKNTFNHCSLRNSRFLRSFVEGCDFTRADLAETEFKSGGFSKNNIKDAQLKGTSFIETAIQDIVFEGRLDECRFEQCSFYNSKFQNTTIRNTFFKNNKKFKRVQFINCKVDKLTFAFLKNNLADLSGITLIED